MRLVAGLSLRELGQAVGLSHTAIRKYERGEAMPSSASLSRIARRLSVPLDYFFREDVPSLGSLNFRDEHHLGPSERQRILAETQEWLERYVAAERTSGSERHANLPTVPGDDVEAAADGLRAAWGVGDDPIANLVEVAEDHGVKILTAKGYREFEALCAGGANGGPCIVVSQDVAGDRQRFRIAHELGHLILAAGEVRSDERRCQRFAGAFLVPRSSAYRELGDKRSGLSLPELHLLKHKYGLSMQAWIYRAAELGIVSQAWAETMKQVFIEQGWVRREPGHQVEPERPTRLEQMVFASLQEQRISYSRAGELLRVPPEAVAEQLRTVGGAR